MLSNHSQDELEPLPLEARASFNNYPFPRANDDFDARFWRELDNRKNRYRGFIGFLKRLVEIEIEGVAVWRLGTSMLGGAAFCGLGLVLLNAGSPSVSVPLTSRRVANSNEIPTTAPRFARELWNESAPRPVNIKPRKSGKEVS